MHNAIVIGSGLGGLVTGAMLARAGKNVLVLERHYIPGGYATSFRRKQYEFEVSLHLIGDLGEGGALREILHELGIDQKVEFLQAKSLYRAIFPHHDITVKGGGYQSYLEGLEHHFPEERHGLEALFETFVKIREEILGMTRKTNRGEKVDVFSYAPTVMNYQNYTLQQLMDQFVQSDQLKSILAQYWMYLGLPPSQVSGVFYAYVWTEYQLFGGFYPQGRSQTISNSLRDLIIEHGGEVRTRQEVVRILMRDGQAYGVETKKGEMMTADMVISNADPKQTFGKLVGYGHLPKRYARKVENLQPSLTCVQAYIVLDMDLPGVYGETNHEVFVNEYYDLDRAYQEMLEHRFETMPYCITIYENLNPDYQKSGKTTLSLFQLCSPEKWRRLEKQEYIKKKQEVIEILLDRLNRQYPGVKEKVEYAELSTPMTNKRYTQNAGGAIYGARQSMDQSLHKRLPQITPIGNLYLVGAWTQPGGGYSAVIWSGYNLAKQLLLRERKGETYVIKR